MKRYFSGSRTALIPLPTSAITSVRCSGEGSSPSTRGGAAASRTSPARARGSRRSARSTPSRCGSRRPARCRRTPAPNPPPARAAARRGRSSPAGSSRAAVADPPAARPDQLLRPVAAATPRPAAPAAPAAPPAPRPHRADRHRPEDLEGDPADLEVIGVLEPLDRAADQRRGRPGVLGARVPRPPGQLGRDEAHRRRARRRPRARRRDPRRQAAAGLHRRKPGLMPERWRRSRRPTPSGASSSRPSSTR